MQARRHANMLGKRRVSLAPQDARNVQAGVVQLISLTSTTTKTTTTTGTGSMGLCRPFDPSQTGGSYAVNSGEAVSQIVDRLYASGHDVPTVPTLCPITATDVADTMRLSRPHHRRPKIIGAGLSLYDLETARPSSLTPWYPSSPPPSSPRLRTFRRRYTPSKTLRF